MGPCFRSDGGGLHNGGLRTSRLLFSRGRAKRKRAHLLLLRSRLVGTAQVRLCPPYAPGYFSVKPKRPSSLRKQGPIPRDLAIGQSGRRLRITTRPCGYGSLLSQGRRWFSKRRPSKKAHPFQNSEPCPSSGSMGTV